MPRLLDLTGMKFGRLTVKRRVINPNKAGTFWECQCDCGNTHISVAICLRTDRSKSCGCLRREMMREAAKTRNLRHGEGSNGKETAEYRAWAAMLSRCTNSNHRNYNDYGGRGITVCDRWRRYEDFLADMGRRPSERHSLDRINNEAGYSPENCRWATYEVQNNNQRRARRDQAISTKTLFEHEGRTQKISAWCREIGLLLETYRARRKAGMSVEAALFTPRQKPGRKSRAYRTQPSS